MDIQIFATENHKMVRLKPPPAEQQTLCIVQVLDMTLYKAKYLLKTKNRANNRGTDQTARNQRFRQ